MPLIGAAKLTASGSGTFRFFGGILPGTFRFFGGILPRAEKPTQN
jgi:hypothetical protein